MARGINLRHALRLPVEWPRARKHLEQWGTSLPLGAVGFHVATTADNSSIATGASVALSFSTPLDDRETWWPLDANAANVLTVPRQLSGVYQLEAGVAFTGVATGVTLSIRVAGLVVASAPANGTRAVVSCVVPLNEGDRLEVLVTNGSGGAVTPTFVAQSSTVARFPYFRGYRLSLL